MMNEKREEAGVAQFPERSWAVLMDGNREVLGYVALTFRIWHEDDAWQGVCSELGVPSFGDTPGATLDSVVDATIGYLNEIEDHGERERIFQEQGLVLKRGEPPEEPTQVQESMAVGQSVSRLDIGLLTSVA
jgi:hypothetical protein